MTPFHDLFRSHRDLPPGEQQRAVAQEFPEVLARSTLRPWSPDPGTAADGPRLVIGVAPYSGPDMRLLDLVQEALTTAHSPEPVAAATPGKGSAPPAAGPARSAPAALRVEVFNAAACKSHEDFGRYVPGIGEVFQTPVVGFWVGDSLREKCWGAPARALVANLCGFDPSAVFRT